MSTASSSTRAEQRARRGRDAARDAARDSARERLTRDPSDPAASRISRSRAPDRVAICIAHKGP
eukprot:11592903-Alexandrium_andersonii.AAC.1